MRLEKQKCVVCEKASLLGFTHPRCGVPYSPDAVISLFDYRDEKVARAIIVGKYYFVRSIYEDLGQSLANYLKEEFPEQMFSGFTLVAVPLSRRRLRWRGYNQSEVVAAVLARELGLPTEDILVRKKNTRTQKDLKKDERLKNVLNSIALSKGAGVRGRNYLLIDDVVTTGATLTEACKALKRNGAYKVWCVTIARD